MKESLSCINHLIGELAKNVGQLVAIDFSGGVKNESESKASTHQNVKFISTNVTSATLDIPLESFDLVFAKSVLEHLSDDEVKTFVESMTKWFKPGGHIFLRETCSNDCVDLNQSNSTPNRDPKFYSKVKAMSTNFEKSASNGQEQSQSHEELLKKIDEVRTAVSPIPEKLSRFCTDASIARYLRARNWNVKKATKMLKDSLKWRSEYKPEQVRWDDIAVEAETGKTYRSTSVDHKGRPVLVMRPCRQNSKSVSGQIKHLVYCVENAILNLPPNQEQMVWLVDFYNFNLSNVSLKAAKETANVLQNHYPERLGVAILYNPPRLFEQFYKVVKPFLEPKTRKKVKFVYDDDMNSKKIMEELFDMDQLESAFGGKSSESFDFEKYALRMREDDEKMHAFWEEGKDVVVAPSCNSLVLCSSLSVNDDDPSEEEDNDGRSTPSSSTPKDSPDPNVDLSLAAVSLEDHGHVKKHDE